MRRRFYREASRYLEHTPYDCACDAWNRLIGRSADLGGDGSADELTAFVHEEGQNVLRFDGDASGTPSTGDLTHRYFWGLAVDQLLADEQIDDPVTRGDDETLWALTDNLGSVMDVVDSAGTLREHRVFDKYGNLVDATHRDAAGLVVAEGQPGYFTVEIAWTGKWFDIATGLQHNWNRWYDPAVGRWISEDPIGFEAGDANLGRYTFNSPNLYTGPTGHLVLFIVIGVGVGFAFGLPRNSHAPMGDLDAGSTDVLDRQRALRNCEEGVDSWICSGKNPLLADVAR